MNYRLPVHRQLEQMSESYVVSQCGLAGRDGYYRPTPIQVEAITHHFVPQLILAGYPTS